MRYLIAKLMFLLVAGCAISCEAQTVTVKEHLDNGELIILVDGIEQRTLTSAHADDIKARLVQLDKLTKALPVCQQLNIDYTKRVDTAKQEANGWQTLYTGEHQLRLDMQQFQRRPSRVSNFLDRWYIKLPITFAPTIVSAMK